MASIARFFLTLSSLFPSLVLFTLVLYVKGSYWCFSVGGVLVGTIIVSILFAYNSIGYTQKIPIEIAKIRPLYPNVLGLSFISSLPLFLWYLPEPKYIGSLSILYFFTACLLSITESFHVNLLAYLFGIRFYEVTTSSGLVLILASKVGIRNPKSINIVEPISSYLYYYQED